MSRDLDLLVIEGGGDDSRCSSFGWRGKSSTLLNFGLVVVFVKLGMGEMEGEIAADLLCDRDFFEVGAFLRVSNGGNSAEG